MTSTEIIESQMGRHVDEYIMFYRVCKSEKYDNRMEECEIIALWKTWCAKKR